jgi:D-inositol-3-phosphate glycosyltransferase
MVKPKSQHIALISVHGDPAIEVGKEEAGGQNVYVRQVGEALGALGWQVDMFTRKASATDAKIVQHTPNCRTIRLTAGPEEFIPRDNLFTYLPEFVARFLAFQQENGIKYPLVHTNYWMSAWVGMKLKQLEGVKQIHTYHSLGAIKYKSVSAIPLIAKTRLNTEKEVLETAERIVATSPQEKEHMRSLVSLKGKIDIIPCGTDIRRFGQVSQEAAREKIGIPRDSQVVFYVGRFDPRKGIETLVRAIAHSQMRHNGKLKLIIGGGSRPGEADGLERERIEALVDELGIQELTTFTGRINDEDLPHYYAAADICVVPSHYEPFGLVAIEAMASRTPVIASDVGGLQFTVVPEMTGLLCPPQDENAFAEAIDRILAHPDWCRQLGDRGRERTEDMFSWSGVAAKLDRLYQACLVDVPVEPVPAVVS